MIVLKILFAHVIGDFLLQPLSWIHHKEKYKLKSSRLYLHILVHIVLMFLLLWDLSLWPLILSIGIVHLIIDGFKVLFSDERNRRRLFFLDQVLHIVAIIFFTHFYGYMGFDFPNLFSTENLIILFGIIFLTKPTSIIMQTIFTKWDISSLFEENESLEDAGKYIGILERLFVFGFILLGHWEAVGFLLTAKSVFRFGDLKDSRHRKLTEYVLIGTLLSFGIATATALVVQSFIT